jgi:hypothetical protein
MPPSPEKLVREGNESATCSGTRSLLQRGGARRIRDHESSTGNGDRDDEGEMYGFMFSKAAAARKEGHERRAPHKLSPDNRAFSTRVPGGGVVCYRDHGRSCGRFANQQHQ